MKHSVYNNEDFETKQTLTMLKNWKKIARLGSHGAGEFIDNYLKCNIFSNIRPGVLCGL